MFINYIVSTLRFLKRNKRFAFINIFGLITGYTSLLLIFFFVFHEFSYDNFHSNQQNIYRVNFAFEDNSGNTNTLVNSPPAFVSGIRGKFPELLKASRLRYIQNCVLANGENKFYEQQGYYADSSFLDILRFNFISGSPGTALDDPNSIVITEEYALKYFGNVDVIGSSLLLNNNIPLKVTGVISNIPNNSHINFDYLISFQNYVVPDGYASDLDSWGWLGFLSYVELVNGANPLEFQKKLQQLFDELTPDGQKPFKPLVQNISNIYFESNNMTDDLSSHLRTGNKSSIFTLILIALLIVFIAGFNYSILTNAISIRRGKEVSIRKVFGAERHTIIFQLLIESVVMSFGCLGLSYGLSILILSQINSTINLGLTIDTNTIIDSLSLMVTISIGLGLLAGIFPALRLSGFNIINALKGEVKFRNKNIFQFKNLMLVLQFAISIGLVSATIVLIQQVEYLKNRSVGFDKENLVIIKLLPEDMSQYYDIYKEKLLANTGVISVSRSDRQIGEPWPFSVALPTDQDSQAGKMVFFDQVDYDYFKTMSIEIREGRAFAKEYQRDSLNGIIINQKAANILNLENPIGKEVHFFDIDGPRTVVGVVEDFNYSSLHQEIGPAVMVLPFIDLEYIYVRLAPGSLSERISLLENKWKEAGFNNPMEWNFVEDKLDELYDAERKISLLIGGFTFIAIILASMGLYGIVIFMINARIKEFGIRKVLGASVTSIYILFIKQYLYQILISMVIITPFLHYFLNIWLQGFAYRIEIAWWTYPISTLLLTAIALLTISYQTYNAAKVDPVNLIRDE